MEWGIGMRRGSHWGGPQWWPEGEHWPPSGGHGYEAWSSFGRKIFLGVALFVGSLLLIAGVVGALIAATVAGVTSSQVSVVVAATVAVLVIGIWLLFSVGRRTWGPVRELMRATGRLSDGDYTARVDVRSSPGMRAVGSSFNSMAARLEEADEQRRRLMADLSHELRTPLAVIRGEVEAVIDGVYAPGPDRLASLLEEVEVMERLIEDLRILTLSDAGQLPLELQQADLLALVEEVATSYRSNAASANVEMVVDVASTPPPIDMDSVRIRQAITNVVVNSITAMTDGGRLTFTVRSEPGRAVVEVADTGSGISSAQLPSVFDRFVKSPDSPGSGLGLSIAKGLVSAHGGDLEIRESSPEGTVVLLWLPV